MSHEVGIRACRFRGAVLFALTSLALGSAGSPAPLAAQQSASAAAPKGAAPTGTAGTAAAALVFDGVTIVDVTDGRLRPGQRVVITGTRIQAVGAASKVGVPRGAQVVDARGKYLIPGLWDMHSHPGRNTDLYDPLLIAAGVTGIRVPGIEMPLDIMLRQRREIAAGQRVGPRMIVSGPLLAPKAGPGGPRIQVTPASVRHVVDSLKAAGADFIKVTAMPAELYFAVAAEARRAGLPFEGHVPGHSGGNAKPDSAPGVVSAIQASDSGARILEHNMGLPHHCQGTTGTLAACTAVAERLRRNGTWVTPTLLVIGGVRSERAVQTLRGHGLRYWPDSLVQQSGLQKEYDQLGDTASATLNPVHPSVRMDLMQRAGMPLLAGTDGGGTGGAMVPGFMLHEDVAAMVWAGLTPLTALQAATLNPAKYLKGTDSLGTVAPGKLADLVLLDADPLADITNTTKVRAVVANGRYFDRAALDALLAAVKQGGIK